MRFVASAGSNSTFYSFSSKLVGNDSLVRGMVDQEPGNFSRTVFTVSGNHIIQLDHVWRDQRYRQGSAEQMSRHVAVTDMDFSKTVRRYSTRSTIQDDQLKFDRLKEAWYVERGISSSLSELTSCPSYLRIIGMGGKALPLILAQIRRENEDPDHWFVALAAITEEDPITDDMFGDTVKMAKAWLAWAEENYVW